MPQGVFDSWERRTRSCWPVIRQLIFNAALPHSGQRRSVTEHQLLCCGEVETTSHIPRTKIVQMEIPLEKFFQIFSHGRLAAFDGMANGALVHALLPGDLAVALAEDQMRLYPDALHLWQRVEGVPQVDEQFIRSRSSCGVGSCRQAEYSIPSSQSREYCALLRVVRR